jgi:hypothetical protein
MCRAGGAELISCYDRLASWLIVCMSDARRLRARWLCSIVMS